VSAETLVVFTLDEDRWALPVRAVERVLPMVAVSPLPRAPRITLGVINVHGTALPVLDLRLRLGRPPRAPEVDAHMVVARTARRLVVLPVDRVLGVQEVSRSAVAAPAAVLPGTGLVSGIVTLPDGLILIQDLDAFLSLEEEQALAAATGESG
jgi:purine-binding chemotaxis protein CheW